MKLIERNVEKFLEFVDLSASQGRREVQNREP